MGLIFFCFLKSNNVSRHPAQFCMFYLFYPIYRNFVIDFFQFRHSINGHDSNPLIIRRTILAMTVIRKPLRQISWRHLIFTRHQIIIQLEFICDIAALPMFYFLEISNRCINSRRYQNNQHQHRRSAYPILICPIPSFHLPYLPLPAFHLLYLPFSDLFIGCLQSVFHNLGNHLFSIFFHILPPRTCWLSISLRSASRPRFRRLNTVFSFIFI